VAGDVTETLLNIRLADTSITALVVRVPPRDAASVNIRSCTGSASIVKHRTEIFRRHRSLPAPMQHIVTKLGWPVIGDMPTD
jgi:hypothetical protein